MSIILACIITLFSIGIILLGRYALGDANRGFHVLLRFIGFMGMISFVYSVRELSHFL
ncbi:hypothetical protein [Exiguobacterium sp. s163]|uniref:hypothetical protein n=1 Tax=Exiguobacterium sp. s163 TaxID=2751287 RepID=UPI001BEAF39F|nr:hypothetical protein [Exiguobacterium sp. s163]